LVNEPSAWQARQVKFDKKQKSLLAQSRRQ